MVPVRNGQREQLENLTTILSMETTLVPYSSPLGSEWRIWDLHLHAPGTKLNDQFKGEGDALWEAYCRRLHESDVQAFGITDYFSADAYFSARREYERRFPRSQKMLLPNVELRTNDVVNKAHEEVNIHLVFNPFVNDHEKNISYFLGSLKTNKTDSNGRHFTASDLSQITHFEEATTTRAFILEALESTFGKSADLLDHVLIITAANNDGIRPIRGKKRKLLITDELDKFSNAFFGNAGNRDYFLGTHRAEDSGLHTPPKPVLSGSDAHSFEDLDQRLGQMVSNSTDGIVLEPTWIKADLTYEGLKQIVFEPENRVLIGEEPATERRVRENSTRYIHSLHVTCIDNYKGQHGSWFNDKTIPLSKELVAIIGNKGSGKSAITDIMGLLGNSHKQRSTSTGRGSEELFSFLNRQKFLKKGCAKNFTGTLFWRGGEPDKSLLNESIDNNLLEKVEYLPQKYLERLCANIEDDEFRKTLNKVIFRYVKPQHRFQQSGLDELIAYLSQQAAEEIDQSKRNLHAANSDVVAMELKLGRSYLREIHEKLKLKKQELQAHDSNRPREVKDPALTRPDAVPGETQRIEAVTKQILSINEEIEKLQDEQMAQSQLAQQLQQAKQDIQLHADSLTQLEAKYHKLLASTGLSFRDIVKLTVDFGAIDTLVAQKTGRLAEIQALLATPEELEQLHARAQDPESAIVAARDLSIVCKKNRLQQLRISLVERQTKPVREYQEYREALQVWSERRKEIKGNQKNPDPSSVEGLSKELNDIEHVYPERLQHAEELRLQISKEIFLRKRNLKRFYDEIKQSIDSEIDRCRDDLGDYSISIEAGLKLDASFIGEFLKYINQAKRGSFYGIEEGSAMMRRFCEEVDDWGNERKVLIAVNNIVQAIHVDQRIAVPNSEDRRRDVFSQLRNGPESLIELYDYLFAFDYLDTKYDLKVDQKDVSELSPGERGGLLLIFYLMLDRRHIPLIIDQPEDNLDNKSVYEILVKFIKEAKKRRQIILVTHNPNLAVVADAEQIIRVSIDKKDARNEFDFFSGSIENPKINRAVVDILEGTLPAFDNRRLKYRRRKGV